MWKVLTTATLLAFTAACWGADPTDAPPAPNAPAAAKPAAVAPTAPTRDDAAMVPPQTAYMVITSGSADRAEAEAQLAAYRAEGLPSVAPYPQVIESATIDGLNAGFWIVVAATVDNEDTAQTMTESLGFLRQGTYYRTVRVSGPEHVSCATEPADPRCRAAEHGWRVVVIFNVEGPAPDANWDAATHAVAAALEPQGVLVGYGPTNDALTVSLPGGPRTVDLSEAINARTFGYYVAMQGAEPQIIASSDPTAVLEEIRQYFTGR